jgi:hypothetical protein
MLKRQFALLIFLLISTAGFSQTVLWEEDFLDEADGATSSSSVGGSLGGSWSVTTTPSAGAATFAKQTFTYRELCIDVPIELFQINNTVTEGVWKSNNIPISGLGEVALEVTLGAGGGSTSDYVRAYYVLDGGPTEVMFGELKGGTTTLSVPQSAVISGTSVQIVIKGFENTTGNQMVCFGVLPQANILAFSYVRLVDINTLYSRATGDWGTNGTWSSVALGGVTCGCTPDENTNVVIGNGHTVSITNDANAIDVTVQNASTLQWTSNNRSLTIERGGDVVVNNGGSITRASATGTSILIDNPFTNKFTVNGSLSVEDINISAAAAVTITNGSGSITLSDDLLMAASASVSNSHAGTFTVTDDIAMAGSNTFANSGPITAGDIAMNGASSTFTNSSTITAGRIFFDDDNNTFTNNATVTLSTGILVNQNTDDGNTVTNNSTLTINGATSIDAGSGDLNINNSGTIDQAGTFANASATSSYKNLSNAIWKYKAVTATAPPSALDCSASGNIFNYEGAGNQGVLGTTYHHIFFKTSGTKTTSANLTANGNLTIQDAAIYSGSIFTTALAGNWSVLNTASFTEATSTVNFNGAAQTISNWSGTETFYNLTLSGSGTKSSTNTLDVDNNLSIAGTAQLDRTSHDFTVGGNWSVTSTNADPFLEGTRKVTLDGAGAQAISTVLAAGETFYNLDITTSGNKTVSSQVNITNNLSLGGTAQLTASAAINIGGNWTVTSSNANPFVEGAQTVTFNGTADQTITNTIAAGETFNNLVLNKNSGRLLLASGGNSTDINIAGTMTFTSGLMITTATESLTFNSGSAVSGGSTSSFVDGPVRKLGNTSFTFPTGDGTNKWARIGITSLAGGAGVATMFTAQYNFNAHSDTDLAAGGGLLRISAVEYWDLTRSGTAASASVMLFWENGTRSGITSNTAANLAVARYTGTDWTAIGNAARTGGASSGTVTSTSVASGSFTAFTFGSNVALPTNPLPVEFDEFAADLVNDQVFLSWSTQTERNNNYFTIERARNTEEFFPIGEIAGHGTSLQGHRYNFTDNDPLEGRSYYRLKQTDYDGKTSYHPELKVIHYIITSPSLEVYPNPVSGNLIKIRIKGLADPTEVPIQIFNQQGLKVLEMTLAPGEDGSIKTELDMQTMLPAGFYIIKAGKTLQLNRKLVVN